MSDQVAKLSIRLTVHNEQDHIADCLESLRFADEVIVQLDRCTDQTKDIAQKFANVTVLEGAWPIEGQRWNEGLAACSGEWILEIDADERVTPELAKEIQKTIKEPQAADRYCTWFHNYIGDKSVRWGWGAYMGVMQKMNLFRKGMKTYVPTARVHPSPIVKGEFGGVLSRGEVLHYLDRDLSDTIRRFDSYCRKRAKELRESGLEKESFGRNFRRLFSRFWKCYVLRKGYREGALGFIIAILAGLYPLVSYIRARDNI